MQRIGRILLTLIIILGITSCDFLKVSPGIEPLPVVSPLLLPQLPEWIEQISPTGEADTLSQILIRFKEPLIPVESLDSPNQKQLLQKFEILPPLPGQFRFLTPRMVGFQADKALPKATRVKVTLKSGLTDLKNHRLDKDLAWTFNTEPLKLTNLTATKSDNPYENPPINIKPILKATSNVELDLDSVRDRAKLMTAGSNKPISLKVQLEKTSNSLQPQEKFDPATRNWTYDLIPQEPLKKATNYRLEFSPGLRPSVGNLVSELPFVSQVKTYSPLQYQTIQFYGQPDAGGTYGRFVEGSPQLVFNNAIDGDSAIENVTISPTLPKNTPKLVQAVDGENIINLNPWALQPNTNYTITIGANLKDTFGQKLGKSVLVKYRTSDVAGDIWTPTGLNIFPSGTNLNLNISTVNLPESKYQAAYKDIQPTDLVYTDSAYPTGEGNDLLPYPNKWESFRVSSQKNQSTNKVIPLREKLGKSTGMLAYGVQAKTNRYLENGQQKWREPSFYGMVQLTNLGVFTQWFPESGLIRVHHLSDGSPAIASVEVYLSKLETKSRTKPVPCATGKTNDSGTLLLSKDDLELCFKSTSVPKLLVIARENTDWAFARTEEYSGAYGYGFDGGEWENGKPISRGVIFSDRQLYQPGEKAEFTGFTYYLKKGELEQDKNVNYNVKLISPDGKDKTLGTIKTNQFGTFSIQLQIPENQALGSYLIQAKNDAGLEHIGEFRVAEFKPPNFKVNLNLDKEFVFINQKIEAKAQSNYLFGSPVEGGKTQYYVTRQQTAFVPKGWDKFSFGKQWFLPEESPVVPNEVLQTNGELDTKGSSNQTVTVAKDLPYPMTYRVDVQVSDVSNLSVSDSKTFTALPSDRLIGLQGNFVADAGKPYPIQLIVTDPTGKVLEGQSVRLQLQQMKFSSVTRLTEGSQTAKNQVEYKTVGQIDVKSSNTPQSISLTPTESGSYRIRANFTDANNDLSATDTQIWATGESPVYWGETDNNRLEVKLDKETYKPGETATALIQSPYPEGELYFAIARNKPLYETITKVKGGAPQIQFQVTPEMLPNAVVEAVLVRQGQPLSQVEPGSVENLVRIGFTTFKVNLDNKYLQVKITPQQAQLEPGNDQTIQLEIQSSLGQEKGQFTVMVVNEAVLQLSGYKLPDLVKTVYAEQTISTRFSDNRPNVVLKPQSSPIQKGWGYGGGLSAGAANTRIRKNFQALAYYNGSIIIDSTGKAQITFKLPDDLTTWRVMVVATDGDFHFGNADSTFITTKPLVSNPVLPQFARPGDRLEAGLSLTNNTGQKGNLSINGSVTSPLQFDQNKNSLQTSIDSGTHAYRFPIVANQSGEGTVRFTTQLNGTSDAFEVPLEVKPLEITEQVVETGTTTKLVKIPVNIDKNTVAGNLNISLASSLIPEITVPAKQVLGEDNLPFTEPIASQLAIASSLKTISQPSLNPQTFISQLQKLQLPDGGFAAYPGQKQSDPFIAPYAARSLAIASQAGISINSGMISRLNSYLKKILADPGQYEFCKSTLCKSQVRLEALMALSELGEKRNDFLADIYSQRGQFDFATQSKLTRYLSNFPEWQDEAKTLFTQLQKNIYQTGRTATVNLPRGFSWLSSPTVAQAQMLRLGIAQNVSSENLDRLLQSLLNLRREGTWGNTYDNAEALTALVEYSQLQSTSPNFATTAKLKGKTLLSAQFKGNNSHQDVTLPIAQLPRGKHDLIINKLGQGTLHYLVGYRYRLSGNQPGRFNGLRVVREIRAVNEEKVLGRQGLYAPDKPLELPVGQVFDVGLEIITDHPVDRVIITDPLPAGFEAVDASFRTSNAALKVKEDDFDFKTIYSDRILAYGDRLEPGIYTLHYLVRSVTPGTYLYPGAEVHLQYAPEEFGRTGDSTLVLTGS